MNHIKDEYTLDTQNAEILLNIAIDIQTKVDKLKEESEEVHITG